MKKKLFLKFFVLAVIGAFVTFTSCKDYDDDINKLQNELNSLKSDMSTKIDAAKSELSATLTTEISKVTSDLAAAKADLATTKAAVAAAETKLAAVEKQAGDNAAAIEAAQKALDKAVADLQDAKDEIVSLAARLDVLETFKAETLTEISSLKAQLVALETALGQKASKEELAEAVATLNGELTKLNDELTALKAEAATKEDLAAAVEVLEEKIDQVQANLDLAVAGLEGRLDDIEVNYAKKQELADALAALKGEITEEIGKVQASLDKLGLEVKAIDDAFKAFLGDFEGNVQDILDEIAKVDSELSLRISTLEALLVLEDGTSTVLDGLAEELDTQFGLISKNTRDINALIGKLADQKTELETLIGNVKSELKGDIDVLDGKITANANAITALGTTLREEIAAEVEALNETIDALDEKLSGMIGDVVDLAYELSNTVLRSLVLIPHHYVNGVEAIGFNPIEYKSCKPGQTNVVANPNNVTVQYYMNPSSVTKDMIDTENISFTYRLKENKFKSADINAKAQFVSIDPATGILTVRVDLDANKAENGSWANGAIDKMDMIALQVPLSAKATNMDPGNDPVVTSDWARVDVDKLTNPVIDRDGFLCDEDKVNYSEDFSKVADAKAATFEDDKPYVLELIYDQKYDLVDFVATTALGSACAEFDPATYGLVYNFDLLDEDGKVIVYKLTDNDTDQQKFINLKDAVKGSIESKVYTTSGTDAIGRTPIVRVQLKDPATGCVVTQGFIKIKWVKEQPVTDVTHPAESADFDCDKEKVGFGVDVEWMNVNVYNKMDTYYEEFIHNYELDDAGIFDEDGELLDWGVVLENSDVGNTTDTDLFKVHLSEICELTEATTFTGYVHYKSKMNGEVAVRIKVTLNVKMPNLTVAGHNNTYWQGGNNSSNVFMVNPVQFKTDPQVNPTANYRTDLLNGFTNGTTYTDDINKIVKSSIAGHVPCNVQFVFDAEKLKSYTYKVEGVDHKVSLGNLRVSADGKSLEFLNDTTWTIASYIKHYAAMPSNPQLPHGGEAIHLNESGQEANAVGSSWPHKYAKALVGQKVPVKLAADLCCETECDLSRDIRKFEVYFIPPMKITSTFTESFTDWVTGGDYINLDKAFTLTDFADYLVAAATPTNPTEKQKWAADLWDYYEINNVVWDTDAATSNIGNNAQGDLDVIPGAKNPLPVNYVITYVDDTTNPNSLRFQNNSGAPLAKDFELYVPVTVGHKWGTLSATVTITVKKP